MKEELLFAFCRGLAARTTRRSVLGRLSTAVLSLLGVHVVSITPRAGSASATEALTVGWELCGIYGKLCEECIYAPDNCCPVEHGCAEGTSFWSACCEEDGLDGWIIEYWDCCAPEEPLGPDGPWDCGEFIANNPDPQPAWCQPGDDYYCCTVVKTTQQSCVP